MRARFWFGLAALALCGAAAQGMAQTSQLPGPPAENPPAGFKDTRYVDSRGCVYLRAGVDGAVVWLPRVTPERTAVCGQTPTPRAATSAAAPAAVAAIPAEAATNATTTNIVAAPLPKAAHRKIAPRKTAPRRVIPMRTPHGPGPLSGATRVIPRHLAAPRAAARGTHSPKGYRPAWKDGRLNARRAEGTLDGSARMNLVWTRTVPRRLIDRRTGEDVTALMARLYPGRGKNGKALGKVTITGRNGKIVKRVIERNIGR